MDRQPLHLTVNGQTCTVAVTPRTTLLQVLREDLDLTGAKYACGFEQCGACRVIVDGEALPACRLPAREAGGKDLITVEGLAAGGQLSPLQAAFVHEQAMQCGYCVAGMLTAGTALLHRNPRPTLADIHAALQRNLCRCGVYPRIIRAIQRAAGQIPDSPVYEVIEPEHPVVAAPRSPTQPLPQSLQRHPDLDDWIHFREDGIVDFFTGKVELGQGIVTALSQVVAEELDVRMDQVRIHTADTARSPNEGSTAGSLSLEVSGGALRQAAAEARHHLLLLAAEEWNVPWEDLSVQEGMIRHGTAGPQASYWELLQGQRLGIQASGVIAPKPPSQYTLVGQPVPRLDLHAKVQGQARFLQDMDMAGMLHARIVRGPYAHAQRTGYDPSVLDALPEPVDIVEDGQFLAVVSARADNVHTALTLLAASCTWETPETLPGTAQLYAAMEQAPSQDYQVVDGWPVAPPVPDQAEWSYPHQVQARFARPYQMHASLGPSGAIALRAADQLTVWSHSQDIFSLRAALAQILKWHPARLRVIHVEGPGCYGHNGADDAALDACLLAIRYPDHPVRVLWTREDEYIYEPYGTAMLMDVAAALDEQGNLAAWRQEIRGYTHLGRPQATDDGTATLLAAWQLAAAWPRHQPQASTGRHVGLHRNGAPPYRMPERVTVVHFLPEQLLRVSAMRSLGAFPNVFAIESIMDELATRAGEDPCAFRLRHLDDARGRAVLQLLADQMTAARAHAAATRGWGWGIAYARYKDQQTYAAVGVTLSVDTATGAVHLQEAFIAADAGQIVNPDGLSAQLEGGLLQAASWTLHEEVTFNRQGVTSVDWDTYPIMRLPEAPQIHVCLIRREGYPVMGAGEAAMCPVPAAIANAIHAATGVRLREMPFRPERVRQALAEAAQPLSECP